MYGLVVIDASLQSEDSLVRFPTETYFHFNFFLRSYLFSQLDKAKIKPSMTFLQTYNYVHMDTCKHKMKKDGGVLYDYKQLVISTHGRIAFQIGKKEKLLSQKGYSLNFHSQADDKVRMIWNIWFDMKKK